MTPAGFWKRLAARLIDMFILSLLTLPIVFFYMPKLQPFVASYQEAIAIADIDAMQRTLSNLTNEMFKALTPIMLLIETLYFSLQEASRYQATFGKRVLGIKVVNRAGQRVTLLQSIARNLAKYISGFIFCIGYLMAAFTRHKQALHDIVTDSFVINSTPSHSGTGTTGSKEDNASSTFVG